MLAVTQLDPSISAIPFPALPQAQAVANAPASSAPASHSGFTFHDFLSIINPLQHLPVISTIYRAVTGDTIGMPEKIAGDALYGGVWGAVASVADAAFEAVTGKDVGDTVLALFTGNNAPKPVVVTADMPATPAAMPVSLSMPAIPASPAQPDAGVA